MSLQANINQFAAQINFSALIVGEQPAITQPVQLQPGAWKLGLLNMVGLSEAGTYVLYDASDDTQKFWGLTYDNWENLNGFIASQNPFTFDGDISTALGNAGKTYVQSFTCTCGITTTLTALSINANKLAIGTVLSGPNFAPGTTVATIVSSSSITISTATLTAGVGVAVTAVTSGIVKGNIPGSNGTNPYSPTSVISGISSTSNIVVNSLLTGAGLPSDCIVLEILSSNDILVSGNVSATTTGVTITGYYTTNSDMLINVATTQNPSTQFIYDAIVGAQGAQTDIDALIAAGNAEKLSLPNGQVSIDVVTFNFMGALA